MVFKSLPTSKHSPIAIHATQTAACKHLHPLESHNALEPTESFPMNSSGNKSAMDFNISPAPSPTPLQLALDALSDIESSSILEAISYFLIGLNVFTQRFGERENILRFEASPLSFSMRITSGPSKDTICIHKERVGAESTLECYVRSEADLKDIGRYILAWKAEVESQSGTLKSVPKTDEELLSILSQRRWNASLVPRFAEAERAIRRNCLLDATIEFLTPFGLQPEHRMGNVVVVDLLPKNTLQDIHKPMDIKIERLDKFVYPLQVAHTATATALNPPYGSQEVKAAPLNISSSVLISQLKSTDAEQVVADGKRQPGKMLRGTSYTMSMQSSGIPKGLVYDLSNLQDVVAFTSRFLAARDEIRTEYVESFASRSEKYGWGKRQEHAFFAPSPRETRVVNCRARVCGLRTEVSLDALLREDRDREDLLRWAEEEVEREADEGGSGEDKREMRRLESENELLDQMRMDWVSGRVDMEMEMGEPMSWADMVEEEMGD
jgi:hypothetical protein